MLVSLAGISIVTSDLSSRVVLALPIFGLEGYNPIVSPFVESYTIEGPLGALPTSVFWIIVNILYWVAWLNLMVGIFNILPMMPLDGGFLFNDGVRSSLKGFKNLVSNKKLKKYFTKVPLFSPIINNEDMKTFLKRSYSIFSEEKSEKIVGKVTLIISLLILGVILTPILISYI